ncbi:MAG TPA: MarR family transcriptional regulator [Mycobacteriales bacterium]|nr:MarR family transcriptional regulator [Mycobacteriales bacterium]
MTNTDEPALADVVARLRRALRRGVRVEVPFEAVSVAQVELMQLLADSPGLRARDISDRLLLAPTTVSTLIGQLLAADLIDRRPDPADRRAWQLHLTADGKKQLRSWQQANRRVLDAALGRLDAADRRAITATLPALARLVQHLDDA